MICELFTTVFQSFILVSAFCQILFSQTTLTVSSTILPSGRQTTTASAVCSLVTVAPVHSLRAQLPKRNKVTQGHSELVAVRSIL